MSEGRIKVIGDWYVTTQGDPLNYVVRRGSGKRSEKKNGSGGGWIDKPQAYCRSLVGALKFIREEIINERLKGAETSLDGALQTISDVNKEFEFMITGKKS